MSIIMMLVGMILADHGAQNPAICALCGLLIPVSVGIEIYLWMK